MQSLTLASEMCGVSQPAVTQALHKLETAVGGALLNRTRQGVFLTERGSVLERRTIRCFALLDPALREVSERLPLIATSTQLKALIAVSEAENFTLAAKRLGLAQPSVHRAVSQLEKEAGQQLFERAGHGLIPTRATRSLERATRLALAELDQLDAELAEFDGREGGRIVIGALPLSRSVLLPKLLAAFRKTRPYLPIEINDGPYPDLLTGLRRGDVDVIIGALRDPAPIGDVVQEPLFHDYLAFVCSPDHPLAGRTVSLDDLAGCAWIVPRIGSPSRGQFDRYFERKNLARPESVIESGSVLFLREILQAGDFVGCVSGAQAEAEISKGLMARIDVEGSWPGRAIGLTRRENWEPTRAQETLLRLLREIAREIDAH